MFRAVRTWWRQLSPLERQSQKVSAKRFVLYPTSGWLVYTAYMERWPYPVIPRVRNAIFGPHNK